MLNEDSTLLAGLAASAFLAATLLPGGSEAVFAALLALRPELTPAALLVATAANTAGGMSTYALGRLLPRKESSAHARTLLRWGSLALLLSWVPLIGDALCASDPPIRAIFVYNSNPVAVAPESAKVVRGFARDDLFVVVHDLFRTDTADYADLLLPATSQLEHLDVHTSYGHLYVQANNPSIAPCGEALPNTELFRRLAAAMGFDEPCFRESDDELARRAFRAGDPRIAGWDWDAVKRDGFRRLALPADDAPFASGGFPTPSGKCEFASASLAAQGHDPLPEVVLPRESPVSNPALAARYPLAFISPPARNFLNSSFANLPAFVAEERGPRLLLHPGDAAPRAIATGDKVRIRNDRGEFLATAEVTDAARPGVVVAPSVWWRKLSPDGRNANAVTGQGLTDLGRAATFYDCLVEVERAEAPA